MQYEIIGLNKILLIITEILCQPLLCRLILVHVLFSRTSDFHFCSDFQQFKFYSDVKQFYK